MTDNSTALEFNAGLRVAQVRIARPTRQLDALTRFYRDGLGLAVIGSFAGHAGYDGVMFGLPGSSHHLEFTQHHGDNPCGIPAPDNLLALYVLDAGQRQDMYQRLAAVGAREVAPENPYWLDKSRTFEDPDGWRVVICAQTGV